MKKNVTYSKNAPTAEDMKFISDKTEELMNALISKFDSKNNDILGAFLFAIAEIDMKALNFKKNNEDNDNYFTVWRESILKFITSNRECYKLTKDLDHH